MLPSPAGIGVRVETRAEWMRPLFDAFYDWKVVRTLPCGLSLRSFCCNDEGEVVTQYMRSMAVRGVNGHSYLEPPEMRTRSSNFAVIAKIPVGWDGLEESEPTPQAAALASAWSMNAQTGGHPGLQTRRGFEISARRSSRGLRPRSGIPLSPPPRAPRLRHQRHARPGADLAAALPPRVALAVSEFLGDLLDPLTPSGVDSWVYGPELKYPALRAPVDLGTYRLRDHPSIYIVGDATGYVDSLIAASVTGIMAAEAML